MELLNNDFGKQEIRTLNKAHVIIFGGGGLIHSYGPHGDSWDRTGTMWNIRMSDLKQLDSQIILYGVGLNHFYNEPGPSYLVQEFFEVLFKKKAIISFRNDGSRDRFFKNYPEFKNETIYEIPDPGVFFRPKTMRKKESYALLQIAADRQHFRYNARFDDFLNLIKMIINAYGNKVYLIPHTVDDQRLYVDLKNLLPARVLPIENRWRKTKKAIRWYQGADFTIATRGHSQICSAGNRIPTFSIATHPKIMGFAEACGISTYCFNFLKEPLDAGFEKFMAFLGELENIRSHLEKVNQKFDQQINDFNRNVLPSVL